ncbi:VCBS domain-containing protein, partial [Acinetobacter guillouiae]
LTITINGTDDLPVAVADVNSINEDAVSVSGNVRSNDTLGDGTAAEHVVSLNGNAVGSYGTLVLNADGTYTYSLDNANPLVQQLAPTETLTETYSYTLTDKDGDTSTA